MLGVCSKRFYFEPAMSIKATNKYTAWTKQRLTASKPSTMSPSSKEDRYGEDRLKVRLHEEMHANKKRKNPRHL